jgi:threonine synthase
MAWLVVQELKAAGVTAFATASTGNSSTSLARAIAAIGGITGHFFCGPRFRPNHLFEESENVIVHEIEGNYVSAGKAAAEFAQRDGMTLEAGFDNWARREGLKEAYLEAFDQMDTPPDALAQAISSGMGVVGGFKGAQEYLSMGLLTGLPQIIMGQQDTCSPMAKGWADGAVALDDEYIVSDPEGPATAILRGDGRSSYPYLRSIAMQTSGAILAAPIALLQRAKEVADEATGGNVCYASATALASMKMAVDQGLVPSTSTALVMLTGLKRVV